MEVHVTKLNGSSHKSEGTLRCSSNSKDNIKRSRSTSPRTFSKGESRHASTSPRGSSKVGESRCAVNKDSHAPTSLQGSSGSANHSIQKEEKLKREGSRSPKESESRRRRSNTSPPASVDREKEKEKVPTLLDSSPVTPREKERRGIFRGITKSRERLNFVSHDGNTSPKDTKRKKVDLDKIESRSNSDLFVTPEKARTTERQDTKKNMKRSSSKTPKDRSTKITPNTSDDMKDSVVVNPEKKVVLEAPEKKVTLDISSVDRSRKSSRENSSRVSPNNSDGLSPREKKKLSRESSERSPRRRDSSRSPRGKAVIGSPKRSPRTPHEVITPTVEKEEKHATPIERRHRSSSRGKSPREKSTVKSRIPKEPSEGKSETPKDSPLNRSTETISFTNPQEAESMVTGSSTTPKKSTFTLPDADTIGRRTSKGAKERPPLKASHSPRDKIFNTLSEGAHKILRSPRDGEGTTSPRESPSGTPTMSRRAKTPSPAPERYETSPRSKNYIMTFSDGIAKTFKGQSPREKNSSQPTSVSQSPRDSPLDASPGEKTKSGAAHQGRSTFRFNSSMEKLGVEEVYEQPLRRVSLSPREKNYINITDGTTKIRRSHSPRARTIISNINFSGAGGSKDSTHSAGTTHTTPPSSNAPTPLDSSSERQPTLGLDDLATSTRTEGSQSPPNESSTSRTTLPIDTIKKAAIRPRSESPRRISSKNRSLSPRELKMSINRMKSSGHSDNLKDSEDTPDYKEYKKLKTSSSAPEGDKTHFGGLSSIKISGRDLFEAFPTPRRTNSSKPMNGSLSNPSLTSRDR